MKSYKHGDRTCYVKAKCRCKECRAANAEYKRNKVADNKGVTEASSAAFYDAFADDKIPQLTHGIPSTYEWWGCRCNDCTGAERDRWASYREAAKQRKLLTSVA